MIFEILFSSETSRNQVKKNFWNISCLKKLSQNFEKSPCAAEALANFFLGPNYSDQTLKKKKKKKKKKIKLINHLILVNWLINGLGDVLLG